MGNDLSVENARLLRPQGPFHLPPTAHPIRSWVDLTLDGSELQPQIIIRDIKREMPWCVVMSPAGEKTWTARIQLPSVPTVLRYYFEFSDGTKYQEHRQLEGRNLPIYGEWEDLDFQIAAYDPDDMPPAWTRGMISYQIFPDRFARSGDIRKGPLLGVYGQEPVILNWDDLPEHPPKGRDFYGGNLPGLTEHLEYLADLGVNCIYLCPVFSSPSNHRYDALDYFEIDPMLGTEQEFVEMVDKAHRLGMKVILDAVYNHCSSDSKYFNGAGHYGKDTGAAQSQASPYYRWFSFKNWPKDYDGWMGLSHMAEFVECPEVEEHFIGPEGVSIYWLKRGIDGWRTDVTRWVTDEFWRRFHRAVRAENPDTYLVAEEWENASNYLVGDTFDAAMNYRFAWAVLGFIAYEKLTPSELDDRLQTWQRDTPPPAQLAQMNLIDSHDTWRALTVCQEDKPRFKQCVAFQLSFPGAPMIYYGDEAGLLGSYAEGGRRAFPWGHLNEEIYDFYKRALAARSQSKALRLGDFKAVVIDNPHHVYGFARCLDGESVYVLMNASDSPAAITIALQPGEDGQWRDALEIHPSVQSQDGQLQLQIQPRGVVWYMR